MVENLKEVSSFGINLADPSNHHHHPSSLSPLDDDFVNLHSPGKLIPLLQVQRWKKPRNL
ncbi:hypothetical protein Lser_V15G02480 [Lactuca serriola]